MGITGAEGPAQKMVAGTRSSWALRGRKASAIWSCSDWRIYADVLKDVRFALAPCLGRGHGHDPPYPGFPMLEGVRAGRHFH
jgi:hypothetical protein